MISVKSSTASNMRENFQEYPYYLFIRKNKNVHAFLTLHCINHYCIYFLLLTRLIDIDFIVIYDFGFYANSVLTLDQIIMTISCQLIIVKYHKNKSKQKQSRELHYLQSNYQIQK